MTADCRLLTLWSLETYVHAHGWGVRVTNQSTLFSTCVCAWNGPAHEAVEPYPRVGGLSFKLYMDWVLHVVGKEHVHAVIESSATVFSVSDFRNRLGL